MIILGLNDSNSAAAIIKNGKLIAASREERFDRIKHSDAFPARAVEYCLAEAGVTLHDVDQVVFAWNPGHELEPQDTAAAVREHKHFLHYIPNNLLGHIGGHKRNKRIASIQEVLQLPESDLKINFVPHHACHAAGCFFISPYDEAAIITTDAYGDDIAMEIFYGRGNKLESISRTSFPYSLGSVYAAVTQYLGFRPNVDEWKVMGLAAYGEPAYYDVFKKIIWFDMQTGNMRIDLDYFSYYIWSSRRFSDLFEKQFGPERYYEDPIERRHKDIAASFQTVVEEVMLAAVAYAVGATGSKNICLSGGCAMNSKMNGRIIAESGIENLYIQPSSDDGGASLGACFYYWNQVLGHERSFVYDHDYWGPGYADDAVEEALLDSKLPYIRVNDIATQAARYVSEGKIVGWFQGRAEYGQRALGNRSIVADPRDPKMKDKINACVKHRESFRPFAPSILEEAVGDYFEVNYPVPFMQKVYDIKPSKRDQIPAVVHEDGSGRLQTVSRSTNPLYWELIDQFRKITGVPLVLNTSFNDNDEPIVTTPKHALRCFFGTGMDVLCIGPFIVTKNGLKES